MKIRITNPNSSFYGEKFTARRVGNVGYSIGDEGKKGMFFFLDEAEIVPKITKKKKSI